MTTPYTRTRNKSSPPIVQSYNSFEYRENGTLYQNTKKTNIVYPNARTMTDVVTPNYENLRDIGSIVMNPCNSIENWESVPALSRGDYTSYLRIPNNQYGKWYATKYINRTIVKAGHADFSDVPEYWDLCAQNLHSKATGNIAQALVTLGELKETIQLIVGVKKRFIKRLAELASKKPGKINRIINNTGSSWLEARYGWRPLLHDIDNLAEAFANAKRLQKLYRDQYLMRYAYTKTWTTQLNGPQPFRPEILNKSSLEDHYSGVLLYRINDDIFDEFDKRFGITALLSTVWELVPFSFVVDRFINIGNTLTYIDNHDLITVESSCITRTQTITSRVSRGRANRQVVGSHPERPTRYGSPPRINHYRKQRQIERRLGIPMPLFPIIDVNLDLPFSLDLFFIGRQLLGK